jgi:predicted dithiol-disulfide oxidoreductase (DUF899 family)
MAVTFPGESAEYRAARNKLLAQETELRRAMEKVAAARRALPPGGLVPEDYVFDGLNDNGVPVKLRLSELFAPGKDSLIIYNFMFPRMPDDMRAKPEQGATARLKREDSPCPSCTAFLDSLDRAAAHLEAAGFNFVVVARTSLDRLLDYGKEREWKNLRLISAANNDFKRDYHSETAEGVQLPILSVFHRDGSGIRHFWSSELLFEKPDPGQDPRHTGTVDLIWNMMDLTPEGRPSTWEEQVQYACCAGEKPARTSDAA